MTTVIGLPSGKEIIVQDGGHLFIDKHNGKETRVFLSLDESRLITIPPAGSSIEFYDEPSSKEFVEHLKKMPKEAPKEEALPYDPNFS